MQASRYQAKIPTIAFPRFLKWLDDPFVEPHGSEADERSGEVAPSGSLVEHVIVGRLDAMSCSYRCDGLQAGERGIAPYPSTIDICFCLVF